MCHLSVDKYVNIGEAVRRILWELQEKIDEDSRIKAMSLDLSQDFGFSFQISPEQPLAISVIHYNPGLHMTFGLCL